MELTREEESAVEEFKEGEMTTRLFEIPVLLDGIHSVRALFDGGSAPYGLIDESTARRLNLPRIPLKRKVGIISFGEYTDARVEEVVYTSLDVGGHRQKRVYFYVVPKLVGEAVIIGRPWFKSQKAYLDPEDNLVIQSSGIKINIDAARKDMDCRHVSAVAFTRLAKGKHYRTAGIFAVSMADINRALAVTKKEIPKPRLPLELQQYAAVFERKLAEVLPPLRGPGVDHKIELIPDQDGRQPDLPFGPLYGMSREELLVLRKTLTEYLDKGFIRVSSSPAAAPVLFVKKPNGGLRFCCDYRALNRLTKKDRYPLPLIRETLAGISKAKWYTKLDIISAFHNIRIAEGDEWKTAFRTRYGLFEWLVTPFGLTNAPSTFQRYINWALREYLDVFCSAYVDDILIYSDGTREEHISHVKKVLQRLEEAGLRADIDKSEFLVKKTKYLGFIIEVGEGIRMDPRKVQAIQEWAPPKSVKGVRGFIGFANFYRQFIPHFSKLVGPLQVLTTKDSMSKPFNLTMEAREAFDNLKQAFMSDQVLAQWDFDLDTVVETDSSGWCLGAALSQISKEGILRPVAFFSKKMSPAECNYEIYDKELLAIIRALEEWRPQLRGVKQFKIITDHKNLEYFMTTRTLSERQVRWSHLLSQFNFTIAYRPGKQGGLPDALTRREQDLPAEKEDERLAYRRLQLLGKHQCEEGVIPEALAQINVIQPKEGPALEDLWTSTTETDMVYQRLAEALRDSAPRFPTELGIRVSVSDCSLVDGQLLYRNRRWVPEGEPLRTGLIQRMHDSPLSGHPGKEGTLFLMRREYFWPGMDADVKRFVRNCRSCGRNTVWRDRRKGLLKPLPIPEQKWQEISIDFMVDLPESEGCTNLLVIVDRLGKGIELVPMKDISSESLARAMIDRVVGYHGLPRAITSDRGTQIIAGMWNEICRIMNIEQRRSTAFHPETDGGTERANQRVQAYVRHFTDYAQSNWVQLMPMAKLALNNQDAASTGVSPFFLDHGYHARTGTELTLPPLHEDIETARNPQEIAEATIAKLSEALSFAQAMMASSQELQERQANLHRDPSWAYKVGDKVWLDLRHLRTDRPSRKFAEQHAMFTVTKVISSHAYKLDTPEGTRSVFHTMYLRPASCDPFPSQVVDDTQPPAILVDDEPEWEVEEILQERMKRGRGRGGPMRKQYLVKWTGYATPTWTDASNMEETAALDAYTAKQALVGQDG
jgi:hypothetical protein